MEKCSSLKEKDENEEKGVGERFVVLFSGAGVVGVVGVVGGLGSVWQKYYGVYGGEKRTMNSHDDDPVEVNVIFYEERINRFGVLSPFDVSLLESYWDAQRNEGIIKSDNEVTHEISSIYSWGTAIIKSLLKRAFVRLETEEDYRDLL